MSPTHKVQTSHFTRHWLNMIIT